MNITRIFGIVVGISMMISSISNFIFIIYSDISKNSGLEILLPIISSIITFWSGMITFISTVIKK